jgi:hypothetical protein
MSLAFLQMALHYRDLFVELSGSDKVYLYDSLLEIDKDLSVKKYGI